MCGILFTTKEIKDKSVTRLLELRGPDDTTTKVHGGYTFVHNLLSLTGDITNQPVERNGIMAMHNGEIYNYLDIDGESTSDIFSIISAYEKYGDEFTKYLDGEFAIILIDTNLQKILFSTDAFRTKPLFYSLEDGHIGLSTFETPLKGIGFNDIKRALPNTTYVIDLNDGSINTSTIKEFDLNQHKNTYDDWITAFEKSIYKRAMQSHPNKMFIGLSSGYDSGAIACALNKLDVDNKSYSIYASENKNVIDNRGSLLKDFVPINLSKDDYEYWSKNVKENCEDFISEQYSYNIKNDKASVGLAYICNLAIKEDRKIYLSGQGADEIFSDYGMFGRSLYANQSTFSGVFPDYLEPHFPWKNFFGGTQEMYIAKEEYVAGSFGIETRYPFLDIQVVQEFLWLTPELKNRYYKSVVYEYLNRNNFPVDTNKKIGFQANKGLV